MENKPWLKQPGELFDIKGYPIYQGDLLRFFHFIGARKKKYYMYKVVIFHEGALRIVCTNQLEPSMASKDPLPGCLLSQEIIDDYEGLILSGYYRPQGVDWISFEDRPRKKRDAAVSSVSTS